MTPQDKFANLKRDRNPMPKNVEVALVESDLYQAFKARPAYQQNDYLGWIIRAKRDATKQKRMKQMLEELAKGDVYMKMSYNPK